MKAPKYAGSKIMIVDNEPGNVQVLERMLGRAGYKNIVSSVHSSVAVDLYIKHRPDILLLDLKMPQMDGFQVLEVLREIEKDSYLPVLVLTAQGDRETMVKALDSGAKDLLHKPFDFTEVLMRIQNIVEVSVLNKENSRQNTLLSNVNKLLEQKVQDRTKEIKMAQAEVILRLGRASEYRDNETGMHIVRMSRLSERLAQAVGMNEEDCELILNASPMHDVGKIGIPDRILLKPGKLNEADWNIMKMHPAIGAEILSGGNTVLLRMAETIALTHHEQWDGSGYPGGLKGEDIPTEGRIVALCDVFDALTSERPYKKAFSVEKSMEIIEEKSGRHFDPKLVDAFKKVLPDMVKISAEFSDASHEMNGKSKMEEIHRMHSEVTEPVPT